MRQIYRRRVIEWLDTMGIYLIDGTVENAINRAYDGSLTAQECASLIRSKIRTAA